MAQALINRIKARGGRIHTMPSGMVFVLTDDRVLADGLVELGGRYHSLSGVTTDHGYKRARGSDKLEWDIWIHQIPVDGETSIYEAAVAARKEPA